MTAKYRILVGLGNDELGYIIPKEDFDPTKYEESMSVGPKAAPMIEAKLKALLTGRVGKPAAFFAVTSALFGFLTVGSILGIKLRRGRERRR
jgi:hypothetical protein